MRKNSFFLLLITTIVAGTVVYKIVNFGSAGSHDLLSTKAQAVETDRESSVKIASGDTFGSLAQTQGIEQTDITAILAASSPIYDLATIHAGKELLFYFDKNSNLLTHIIYEPNSEDQIVITKQPDGWHAEKKIIEYEIRQKKISGTIDSSLYETGMAQNIDERAIIALADVFQWEVNFAIDVQKGDSFTMLYEERYRDGHYIMPGAVLAATFNNNGKTFKGYYYKESDENEGYFDENGASLERIFLKAPLQYRYISSGFQRSRVNPFTHHAGSHLAIDYAASYGTPAVSVGDGTVIFAGWRTGYGNSVDVRHNETYVTRYGHFSKLAVKSGQKVTQGQTVGYVGSTGWSTGPHLHFELHKNGVPVNPLTIELPASKSLAPATLPAFQEFIKQFEL